jgi:TRAP-type C4-dicarboxylate transport system permease small subunit
MKFSKKFTKTFDNGLTDLSIAVMGVMATLVVISVILRYVFNITYVWSEELIIYLFVATTYVGSVICVKDKEHIDIPFIRERVPESVGMIMDVVVCLINIVVQISLAYLSFTWIEKTGSSLTSGMYIPLYIVYSIFPVCFILMAIYGFRSLENEIFLKIKEKIKTKLSWNFVNITFFGIYILGLGFLGYLFFSIEWFKKIEESLNPIMMAVIFIIFLIMFSACAALVVTYIIKRFKSIFMKNSYLEVGGKQ